MHDLFPSYARLLRNRRYFPVWLGQLISNLGDTLHYIALVVWVYQRTGSSLVVAGTMLFEVVPVIVLAPLAGVVIDRLPRKRVLVASDVIRTGLVLALLVTTDLWQIYAIVVLLTGTAVFFNPALSATLPTLLNAEDLQAANSVSWSTGQLVQIAGSALAGGLIAAFGVRAAFVFNASTFAISAGLLWLGPMSVAQRVPDRGWTGFIADARAGLRYARHDAFISRLMLVQAFASLSVGATSALLVVLAQEHYRLPPAAFSSFILAIGLGALLGPFLLAMLTRDVRRPAWLFGPYVLRGIGDILLGVTRWAPLAWLLLFIYGLNTSSGMVTYQTWLQREVPDRVRGRVFTTLDVVWNGMTIVSLGFGGWLRRLVSKWSITWVGRCWPCPECWVSGCCEL